jgi:hypothetical protein
MVTFLEAYDAAVARHSDKPWVNTNPAEFAHAIYLEMRRMDAKDVAERLRSSETRHDMSAVQTAQ